MVARGLLVATVPLAAGLSGGRFPSGLGASRADDVVTYLMPRAQTA